MSEMKDIDYKRSIDTIIYICSCGINNCHISQDYISNADLENIFLVAKKHMLTSIVGQFLKNNGITTDIFDSSIAMAIRKIIILENEYNNIVSKLESSKIWYMPLKGMVLKNFYPSLAMREMSDIDVFFDETRANDVKLIMENLGYQIKSFGVKNDDDYFKLPVSNIEMHRKLFGKTHDKKFYEYYRNIKERLQKDIDNNLGYHFRADDFYIFMIVHEFKHFSTGGTGLRSLLDTYIYLNNITLDMNYIKTETMKLGINDYEEINRSLALKVFSVGEVSLSVEEQDMLDYIINSGVYGNFKNSIEHKVNQEGGKITYIFHRLWGPSKNSPHYYSFRKEYSVFYKYPILLLFLPIYRLFRSYKNNNKRILSELKI